MRRDEVGRRAVLLAGAGLAIASASQSARAYARESITITVAPDGTADFLSPKLACASITDSAPDRTYLIIISPGVYPETEWTVPPYTTLRGTSREACHLRGSLPDSATDAQITYTSTLWLKGTAGLENLTISAVNMRYAVHSEDSGGNVDAVHQVINCSIEHSGNEGARAWRRAHPESGMSPDTVWNSDRPWGYGSASGIHARFEDCSFISGHGAPWYVHTNKDFAKPNRNELINCDLNHTGPAPTQSIFAVQALGSGQADSVTMTDCRFAGGYHLTDDDLPWISEKPERQVANHAEIGITLENCPLIGYHPRHRGRALRITAPTDDAIEVIGDAATVILGQVHRRLGGGGLGSYLYGSWDISGILVGLYSNIAVDNTLGRRLGDCRTTPRHLDVTVGSHNATVVFDQDHRTQSNATILELINTRLTGIATVDDYHVTAGETYPHFTDREAMMTNGGTLGIPRWSAVVAAGTGTMRLADTGTAAAELIGIAIEPIPPGRPGRMLRAGIFSPSQLAGVTEPQIPAGAVVHLSDQQAGTFTLTGDNPVGSAAIDGWVVVDRR